MAAVHRAREDRQKVLIRAQMCAGGPQMDVCIRDVSSRGLLVQASEPPPRGAYVELVYGSAEVVGRVIWCKDRRFGIQSRERINVPALISGLATAAPPRRSAAMRPAAVRADAGRASGAMEYAAITAIVLFLVAILGMAAFETLSRPVSDISAKLDG